MNLPAWLMARAWPGVAPWFFQVLGSIVIFEFLGILAIPGNKLPDMATAVIAVPAATFILLIVIAFCWTFLARIPFGGGLSFLAKLLPLAWIFPLFDLVRTLGSKPVAPPLIGMGAGITPVVNGTGFLFSIVTGGLLPLGSGLSVGTRLGMFAAVIVSSLVVWHFTKRIWKAAVTALVVSLTLTKVMYFASALGLWQRLVNGMPWAADVADVSQAALLALSNGYWWTNVYNRFPTAVDVQALIALRLTTAGTFVFVIGILLIVLFVFLIRPWKAIGRHVYLSWGAFDVMLYAVGGGVFAMLSATNVRMSGWGWPAFFLFVLLLASLRFLSALQRCLVRLREDEQANVDQPLVRGDLNPETAKEMILVMLLYVLASSWLLGWPVFSMILTYLSASALTRNHGWIAWPVLHPMFRSIGASSLALVGFFFVAQTANALSTTAVLAALFAAAHRLLVEFVWIPRTSGLRKTEYDNGLRNFE